MDEKAINELHSIQTRSLSNFVQRQLEKMIITGIIKPGGRINESKLARDLNISRAPIREACNKLMEFGLVRSQPNKGHFVVKIESKDVDELCDIRAAFEALAGEKAAENFHNKDMKLFEPIIREMEALVQKGDVNGYYFANLNFHLAIIDLSGNRHLRRLYSNTFKKITLFRSSFININNEVSMINSLKEHKQILSAISEGNSVKAASLLRNHVLSFKEEIFGLN